MISEFNFLKKLNRIIADDEHDVIEIADMIHVPKATVIREIEALERKGFVHSRKVDFTEVGFDPFGNPQIWSYRTVYQLTSSGFQQIAEYRIRFWGTMAAILSLIATLFFSSLSLRQDRRETPADPQSQATEEG